MMSIEMTALASVLGAADNTKFGRCGPGSGMAFLGDVYTPECAAHDAAVRGSQANGDSKAWSHVKALPLLPAAVGSYVRGLVTGR